MRKVLYTLFTLILSSFIFSCSDMNMRTSSISFYLPEEIASYAKADAMVVGGSGGEISRVESSPSPENIVYTCAVNLLGDYKTSSSTDFTGISALQNALITIDDVPVESVIQIVVQILADGKVIYEGASDNIRVSANINDVTVVLSRKSNSSFAGIIESKYASARVGDIILADGTICSPDDYDGTTMIPAAVEIHMINLNV